MVEAEASVSAGSRVCKAQRAGPPVSPKPWLLLRAGGHLGFPSLKESEGPQWRLGPSAWRWESLLLTHHWASRPFSCPPRPPSLEAHVTLRAQTLPSRLCSSQPQASPRPWALATSSPLPSDPPPACILGDSHLCTQRPSGARALSAGAGPPSLPQPPGAPRWLPHLWPLAPPVLPLVQGPVAPTPPRFPHGSTQVASTLVQECGPAADILSRPALCGAGLADQGPPDLGPLCSFGPHHAPIWGNPVSSSCPRCFRHHS